MGMTAWNQLRWIGYFEGTSFLLLLGVAMPLKYWAKRPESVLVLGWIHGILFMLYLAAAARVAWRHAWPWSRIAGALLASVLPLGPFIFDARVLRTEDPINTPLANSEQ